MVKVENTYKLFQLKKLMKAATKVYKNDFLIIN